MGSDNVLFGDTIACVYCWLFSSNRRWIKKYFFLLFFLMIGLQDSVVKIGAGGDVMKIIY
jgi:hypothetical protein